MENIEQARYEEKLNKTLEAMREAVALLDAIRQAYSHDGDMPETLALMLEDRVQRTIGNLEEILTICQLPF